MDSPFEPTVEDYRWLVGPDGRVVLDEVRDAQPAQSLVQVTQRLRKRLSAPRAHLVLQQTELRLRGREKFRDAEWMFFTPRLLEQSTDEWVAAYKASRFPAGAPVADLCCGLGGDSLGLAGRGHVSAIDRDEVAAVLAEANFEAGLGMAPRNATLITADVADFSLQDFAAWHIDPDRRPHGGRTTRVELHDPGPEVLRRLLDDCPHAAIKLAPAAVFEEPWWGEAELEWIGRGRQCRQLVAWFGSLAQNPGRRRATVLRASGGPTKSATFVGELDVEPPLAEQVGRFIFEPDAAVLAAKLEGALAAHHGLSAVAPGIAYLTGEQPIDDDTLVSFEVLETMPYRAKSVRAWLGERGVGQVEVKKRGVGLDPENVRRELRGAGADVATVLLAPIAGRPMAIIARRVPQPTEH